MEMGLDTIMATHYSPKIVTDGLVFYYDKANVKKSWIGEPTTNLAMTSGSVTDWTIGNLSASVTLATITANSKYSITSTTGGSFRIRFNLANLVNAETYNLSFNYSIESGGPTFYMSDWNDTSVTRTETSNGDGTFFQTAYGSRATYDATYRFMDFVISANTVIHIWDIQLEERAYYTPYTSYQRTNTEAIVDLTGNTTMTATSLTYVQDDFSFVSASADVISSSTNFNLTANKIGVTYSFWCNVSTATGYLIWRDTGILIEVRSTPQFRFRLNFDASVWGTEVTSSFTLGVWNNVVVTWNGSLVQSYINGAPANSAANVYTNTSNTGNIMNIGRRAVSFEGDIDCVSIYDKSLTAAEVQHNFEAHRGRFGI